MNGTIRPIRTILAERGVTLIEASIVIATVAVLSAVLAPSAAGYIEQARQARTREDIKAIADAISSFIEDTGEHQFLRNGSNGAFPESPPTRADSNRVNLLVSDGDIPVLSTAVSSDTLWTQAVDAASGYDTLSNHLAENLPGETAGQRYRNPADIAIPSSGGQNIDFARPESGGFNAPHAWRGPYLPSPANADPWGNRYAVNTVFLDPAATTTVTGVPTFAAADYPRLDVFVLSAGADEEIDTAVAQDGAVPGDDDFIFIVSSHAK